MRIDFLNDSQEINFLTKQINQENEQFGTAYPFGFFIKNGEEIIAGCNGSVVFGVIYTDQLWVHLNHRKLGLGRKLLEHVHEYGHTHGCTMSFQGAKEFYEKLGYIVDFERKGYSKDSSCIFLRKDL